MSPTLQPGLPEHLRPEAAQLYWQAFGAKLGRVMGPETRALAYLERVINAGQVIVALDAGGGLLGIAGFKTPEGSFAGGSRRDIIACYGWFGGMWRSLALGLLASEVDNDRFLLDGISVRPQMRSQGLGSALMQAICDEALRRGYHAVRLDVIDTNWRAKALYQRLGFRVLKTQRIGLLRYVFGFAATLTMVRTLAEAGPVGPRP